MGDGKLRTLTCSVIKGKESLGLWRGTLVEGGEVESVLLLKAVREAGRRTAGMAGRTSWLVALMHTNPRLGSREG